MKEFEIGNIVTWRPNNGFWVTGPITGIEDGVLIVKSIGYPGGDGWKVDPRVFTVTRKEV